MALGALGLHDPGETERSYISQHPYGIYMEKLLLAMLGSCTTSKRNHSGLGMRCHTGEPYVARGQAGCCDLIDSLHRATWDGSRAVPQWEERNAGQVKAVAVYSWVSLRA